MDLQDVGSVPAILSRCEIPDGVTDLSDVPCIIVKKETDDMVASYESRVRNMMNGFGQDCPEKPTVADEKTRCLRARLMLEEVWEYCEAAGVGVFLRHEYIQGIGGRMAGSLRFSDITLIPDGKPDLVEMGDAVADIHVVATGTAIAHGLPLEAICEAVNDNNDLKLQTGRVCEITGKFLKHADHPKVDLRPLLEKAGWSG